jgi:hypothetical protein
MRAAIALAAALPVIGLLVAAGLTEAPPRGNGNCPSGGVFPSCSGISQAPYDFTTLYKGFNG